jgi:hypothetical protein
VLARALGLSCGSLEISTRAKAGELALSRGTTRVSSRLGLRSDLRRPVVRQRACWWCRDGRSPLACALKAVSTSRLVTRLDRAITMPAWSGVRCPFCRVSLVLSDVPHRQVIRRDLVYGVAAVILSGL